MLHRETLSPSTLDLLISLCAHSAVAPFALTGGTALALRYGHRKSIDLDFFTPISFDSNVLTDELAKDFSLTVFRRTQNGLNLLIQNVKVDFVTYRYALLEPFESIEGVRLFGLKDNIGMKLAALTNRGARKDFFDVHRLIKEFGVSELLSIYMAKFPNHDPTIMLRSLCYFGDAEDSEEPESLDGTDWDTVQAAVSAAVKELL